MYHRSYYDSLGAERDLAGWPGAKPELIDGETRVFGTGGKGPSGVVLCSHGIAIQIVGIGDMVGVAEIGDVELTASREFIQDDTGGAGAKKLAERLVSGLRPEIVAKLNDLERYGMIPARLNFLRATAKYYGPDVLQATGLHWIPVLEPPGNLIHRSKKEVLHLLAGTRRVVLASGVSARSLYRSALPLISAADLGSRVVILTSQELEVKYNDSDRFKHAKEPCPIDGPLGELLAKLEDSPSELILTEQVIDIVAEAWGMSRATILDQRWYLDWQRDVIWTDLTREDGAR